MKKMLKRADGSTSKRGLWDNIRAKAAANKKAGKKGKAPSEDILKAEASIESKKMGGNWLKESQELNFGGPTPGTTPAPTMSFEEGLKGFMSGKMTGAEANAATGYGNKTKKYTDAENKANLAKVFVGSHTVDAQGNVVTKRTGGKKRMGGKNC